MYSGTIQLVQCCHCGQMFRKTEIKKHMKDEDGKMVRLERARKLLEKRKAEAKKKTVFSDFTVCTVLHYKH